MPSLATRPALVGMPAAWLPDYCPCPLGRDPVCGQRLLHITGIPADIAVAEVLTPGRTVSVLAHPDGVESAVAVGERAATGVIRRKDRT
jgi:hypothetical protein